jgi:hypothetical protein
VPLTLVTSLILAAAACMLVPGPARSQELPPTHGLVTIGGWAEEGIRLDRLLGRRTGGGSLIRSPSSETPPLSGRGRFAAALLRPEAVTVWNSGLPFSFNEGSLWAGRGLNLRVMAGAMVELGPLRLVLAPQLSHQANRDFQVIPFSNAHDTTRHPLSSPSHGRPESIDLPSRFGERPFSVLDAGQSSATLTVGPLAGGASTENLWWGPGIRNAIVMSNHAPGIPHLFLRTAAPVSSRLGELEARWVLGRLEESDYFNTSGHDDVRSFSGLALAFRPAFEPELSVGFARAVYAPAASGRVSLEAALDVFRSVGRPNAHPPDDLLREVGPDQVFSLFGRWRFPVAGFEAYAEWARYEEPASLRDLLVLPHHSQGYTLGAQWARPLPGTSALRLQAEATNLEPSASYRHRPVISWYTSRPVPQGYTHRGQVIGAAIGPGASSQWAAADYFMPSNRSAGLFVGRIRWDNAAFYRPAPRAFFAHDVSLYLGVRGSLPLGPMQATAELSSGKRFNYLFQSEMDDWEQMHAVDVRNHSLRISLSPRAALR